MEYQLKTHCPNCFQLSSTKVCASCQFDKEAYLTDYAAAHHLPLFTRLEKGYVIGRVLGEGSFAIVYAAIREKDFLSSAIKEYYPRDLAQRGLDSKTVKPKRQQEQLTTWQNHFIREAELLRSCYDHPSVESGVVHYTALINQHNTSYLVMERLNGISLADYLSEQKQLSAQQICLWLKPLLETLQKLHAKEIYHRDISPNNIFLSAQDKPVLMDFGLAREGVRDELLKPSTLGTGTFIAPEQLTGAYCDHRTDLYALGAVIYLCLHGQAPPPVEARRQGASLNLLNSTDKNAQILQTVAVHCLQLNANLRPKSTTQLLTELSPLWATQTSYATQFVDSITPTRTAVHSNFNHTPELRQPLVKPTSLMRSLLMFLCALGAVISLVYGGYIAYQSYDLQQAQERKQDNLLFSQSQSITDYKNYLSNCITCENQQRALERISQLEKEQQNLLSQQKQYEQEALLFSKAQTLEDFQTYLSTCVQCTDKPKAEEKLIELAETLKLEDEKQLAEQEKSIIAALKSKGSSTDFYQQWCPKNIAFWQRTAEQGYAVAQLLLGGCYRSGDGVKQDYVETLKWYKKAAEQGNAFAQTNLGMMYQSGYGTEKNLKEATKWYRKAAEQNQTNAQYLLGVLYEKGQGVQQDDKQAVEWYLRAAEQENADAQYSLGVMYHYGTGVTQDYQTAIMWYQKAAEQGNDKAQYLLGIMYENGYGVEADTTEALIWYKKAAAQGNSEAKAQLKILESKPPASFSAE
jgi:hypothetical protein